MGIKTLYCPQTWQKSRRRINTFAEGILEFSLSFSLSLCLKQSAAATWRTHNIFKFMTCFYARHLLHFVANFRYRHHNIYMMQWWVHKRMHFPVTHICTSKTKWWDPILAAASSFSEVFKMQMMQDIVIRPASWRASDVILDCASYTRRRIVGRIIGIQWTPEPIIHPQSHTIQGSFALLQSALEETPKNVFYIKQFYEFYERDTLLEFIVWGLILIYLH